MNSLLRKALTVRGMHYLLTRYGPSSLQRLSFDEKFLKGEWNFVEDASPRLVEVIKKYSKDGHVVMLGCGTAGITNSLPLGSFASFLGVDLSSAAINIASQRSNSKVRFEQGDMLGFRPRDKYAVILMSESLYYVPPLKRKRFLKNLSASLAPGGQIVVTISQAARFTGLLQMIRKLFTVQEDEKIGPGERHLIVFR